MADLNEKINEVTNTVDHTDEFDAEDIRSNKVMAILSYFGILVLIPILGAKDSKYARFHANQGLIFILAAIVLSVILNLLGKIPVIRIVASAASVLVYLAELIVFVIGVVNAANGKAKELPFIGGFKLLS